MKVRAKVLQETRTWLDKVVIGLQLCPFAKIPYDLGKVRLSVYRADNMSMWLQYVYDELIHIEKTPADLLSNSLLILPNGPQDFEDFLDLVDMTEVLIQDQGLSKTFQLAHFHPHYVFAGVQADDPSNYTNRSPYPILHLLRVDEVATAIESHPDIHSVAPDNIHKMRELGVDKITALTR